MLNFNANAMSFYFRRMTTQFDAKIRSKNYDTNGDNGRVEEHSRLLRSIENNDIGGDGRERRSSDLRTEWREEISRERRSEIHPERSLRRSNERKAQRRTNVEMRERAGLQSRENRSERGRIYGRNIPTQGRNNVEMRERAKTQTLRGAIESERNRLDDRNVPTIKRNKMVRSDRAANTDSERTSRTVESHEEPRRDFDRAVNTKTDSINQMRSHIRPQEQREERRENNDNHEQRTDENIDRMPIRTRQNRREEENDEDIRRDTVEENSEERREDRQSEKRIRMRRDIERRIRNMHSDRIDVRGEISGPQIDYLELHGDLYQENIGRREDRSKESRLQRISEIVRKNAESRLRLDTREHNRNENLKSKREDRLDSRTLAHRDRAGQRQRLRSDQDRHSIETRENIDISTQRDSIPRRISDRVARVSAEVRRNLMARARYNRESDLRRSVDRVTDTESRKRQSSEESRNRRQTIQYLRRPRNERNSQRETYRINERDSIDERRASIDDKKTTMDRSRDLSELDSRRSIEREADAESNRRTRSEESRNRRQDVHDLRRNRNERNSERDTHRINERDYIEARRALIDDRKTDMERSRDMRESVLRRSVDRVTDTESRKRQLSEESRNRRQDLHDLRRNRNERNSEHVVYRINEMDSNEERRATIEDRNTIIAQARAMRGYDSRRSVDRELDTETHRRQTVETSRNRRQDLYDLRRDRNERNSEREEHRDDRDSNEDRQTSIAGRRMQRAKASRDTDFRRSVNRELDVESNRRHISEESSNRRRDMHASRSNRNERDLPVDENRINEVTSNNERRALVNVKRNNMERGRNTRESESRRSAERVVNTESNRRQSLRRYDMDGSRMLVDEMHIAKHSRKARQEGTEEQLEELTSEWRTGVPQPRILSKPYSYLQFTPKHFHQILPTSLDCSKTFA